ncbi:MAG TPA: hypothetical protein VK152_00245 [Paludibacter sp.]|nr:hypothetical protein [Paludibacter sp.]
MSIDDESCAELQRLEKAIADVVKSTGISRMNDRQKLDILRDHDELRKLIDHFMKL